MLFQVNETIHSGSLPYQICLIPGIPEDAQQTVRNATNYIIVPLDVLVAFLSLLSNGLVITVVIRTRSLQNPPLLLLCNLSISDLLWALYTLFRATLRYTSEGFCPEKKTGPWVFSLCFGATVGNLTFISIDRYSAVSKPLLYRSNVKRSRVLKQALAVWLSSFISSGFVYAKEHSLISSIVPLVAIRFHICVFPNHNDLLLYWHTYRKYTPQSSHASARARRSNARNNTTREKIGKHSRYDPDCAAVNFRTSDFFPVNSVTFRVCRSGWKYHCLDTISWFRYLIKWIVKSAFELWTE